MAIFQRAWFGTVLSVLLAMAASPQGVPYARSFKRPPREVESALNELQAFSGQKLPIVDGFVAAVEKPLNQYERAFYQFSIDILPGTTGDTIVRVTAKITAWYADKDPAKSGYQVLPSSGRLELDLLDRLEEKFGGKPASSVARVLSNATISAPAPKLELGAISGAKAPSAGNSALKPGTPPDEVDSLRSASETEEKRMSELNTELQSLEEIQKHQAHPLNLVVVKKTGAPVLAKPADGAHLLFNADSEDEFEFIDGDAEWIHVQISGPSRGYIRRNNLELSEFISARLGTPSGAKSEDKPTVFRIVREEVSPFPGNWEPLKGKTVKIITVQPVSQDPKETGPAAKLSFARAFFQNASLDSGAPGVALEGALVIFDSVDGGMAGVTLASLKQFRAGTLLPEDFWKQCYLDPPETFLQSGKP